MPDKLGDKLRLLHILDAISEIENYTAEVSKDDFSNNSLVFNASLRQLEIIGEASNRLSENFIQKHQDIPWARIIGLRNLIIHEYFSVDDFTIWNIIQINLPDLKSKIEKVIEEESL